MIIILIGLQNKDKIAIKLIISYIFDKFDFIFFGFEHFLTLLYLRFYYK